MAQVLGNRFNNHTGPSGDLNGSRGKFTPAQTEQRKKVHAMALATGYPTYEQIVQDWKTRFDIDITVQSEKEWRKSNRTAIEKKKQELIEAGDIEIPIVSDRVLADSMMTLVIETSKTMALAQKKTRIVLNKINIEFDDTFDSKVEFQKLKTYDSLVESVAKLSAGVTKQFEKMSDLAGKVKLSDAGRKKADESFERKMLEEQQKTDDFDPVETEVSDEDRESAQ